MTKKLIIFRYRELFNILEEIKENFEFKLEFYEKERELENLENDNLSDELSKLNKLYNDGVLTKEEFEKAKKKILDK